MKKEKQMQKIMKKYIDEYPILKGNVFYFFGHVLAEYSQYIEEELDKLRPDNPPTNKNKKLLLKRILSKNSVHIEQELDKLRLDNTSSSKLYEEVYTLRQTQYQEEKLFS